MQNPINIITITQDPVLKYDLVVSKGLDIKRRVDALNLDELEVTEYNLSNIKKIKASFNKEFATYEEQRKTVKARQLKPYNDFEVVYKENIKKVFANADKTLKQKIDFFINNLIAEKTNGLAAYFNENNKYDFVEFNDLKLNIIKSKTDKQLKDDIDTFLTRVDNDVITIQTLKNKTRVLAQYQINGYDLHKAILTTQKEEEKEKEIKQTSKDKTENVITVTFSVTATKEKVIKLREYMQTEGVYYE